MFRDGEAGRRHQPEFTLVEWYRLDHGLDEIIDDTLQLIRTALDARAPDGDVDIVDYADAFRALCGIDIASTRCAELADGADADDELRACAWR